MGNVEWLDSVEERAWRGFRRMWIHLDAQLARDLAAGSELSMADYAVLSTLTEVDDERWRVTELAAHMEWSQSRLSHHLARMQDRDLVKRETDPRDARAAVVTLTNRGREAITEAATEHVAAVRKRFISVATREELRTLADLADRVVDRLSIPT